MDDKLKQDLQKQFSALPPEVQKAITDTNLPVKLQEIVKNNKLMIDQAGGLETAVILTLFGLEPLENFTNNLIKNVGLSSIQASVITHDVNESIFKNVRENLKQINDAVAGAEKQATTEVEKSVVKNEENILVEPEKSEAIKINQTAIPPATVSNPILTPIKINISKPETQSEISKEGIEIRINNIPEVAPKTELPAMSTSAPKSVEPLHTNVPPIENIVQTKMANTITIQKQTIVVENQTKIPSKPKNMGSDPYREPII